MKVVVDTCVWSQALRRQDADDHRVVWELKELINEMRVQMVGPVRQELLAGVRVKSQFLNLREHLRAFPDLLLHAEDFETAAEFFNQCRSKGIQGSNTDFLLCSLSVRHNLAIFTVDADFNRYAEHLPIRLHALRSD
jgi:predicted nucleic acid-binding protein